MFVQVKLEVKVELEVELKPKHSRKKNPKLLLPLLMLTWLPVREGGGWEKRGEAGQSPLDCVALIAPNFA